VNVLTAHVPSAHVLAVCFVGAGLLCDIRNTSRTVARWIAIGPWPGIISTSVWYPFL